MIQCATEEAIWLYFKVSPSLASVIWILQVWWDSVNGMEHKFPGWTFSPLAELVSSTMEAVICGRGVLILWPSKTSRVKLTSITHQVGNIALTATETSNRHIERICTSAKDILCLNASCIHKPFKRWRMRMIFFNNSSQWVKAICCLTHLKLQIIPFESIETCWRENSAVVIFGLAFVFFRTYTFSIPMCAGVNIYFTVQMKTAGNHCNYSPGTYLSTRW